MKVGIEETPSDIAVSWQTSTSTLRNTALGYVWDICSKKGEMRRHGWHLKHCTYIMKINKQSWKEMNELQ